MSGETKNNPLAEIEAMEAAAFRTGHIARRLLADHPDLPVTRIRPGLVAIGQAGLEIDAGTVDDARAWADRLGLQTEQKIDSFRYRSGHDTVYESCHAEGQVEGVHIDVVGTRLVMGAEADAWLAAQLAEKDTPRGDVHSADEAAGGTGE